MLVCVRVCVGGDIYGQARVAATDSRHLDFIAFAADGDARPCKGEWPRRTVQARSTTAAHNTHLIQRCQDRSHCAGLPTVPICMCRGLKDRCYDRVGERQIRSRGNGFCAVTAWTASGAAATMAKLWTPTREALRTYSDSQIVGQSDSRTVGHVRGCRTVGQSYSRAVGQSVT